MGKITSITDRRSEIGSETIKVLQEKLDEYLAIFEELEAKDNRDRMRKKAGLKGRSAEEIYADRRRLREAKNAFDDEFRKRTTYEQRLDFGRQSFKAMSSMSAEERLKQEEELEAELDESELDEYEDFFTEEEKAAFWENLGKESDTTKKYRENMERMAIEQDPYLEEKIKIRKQLIMELQ